MFAPLALAETAPAGYPFEAGFRPSKPRAEARDDADFQRAVVAYRFWYPTVSMEGVFDGQRSIGIEDNKAMIASRRRRT